jgi:hypothetical protein
MMQMPQMLSEQDNRLLRAWRRGELGDEASQAFEVRLFLEPDLLRAAQLDQALAEGLADCGPVPSRRVAASRRRALGGLALAAGLAGLALWPLLPSAPGALTAGNIEWVSVDVRRGQDAPMLVAPRASTQLLAMELPAPIGSEVFDVLLQAQHGGQAPIHFSQLRAEDGVLSLAFERAALGAGVYQLEIRRHGVDGEPPASRLSFRYQP